MEKVMFLLLATNPSPSTDRQILLALLLGRVALYQKVYKASETIELPEAQQGCDRRETPEILNHAPIGFL
ncbi:hypothetical protein NC652_026445 [Populus alba x Populus x berolinensis]|nr:hypothetical protein NC652_026445 [Populus alba x Populus x berolinensis]